MAKSARASSTKSNRTNLRRKVFGPVEQARAERLSAKLVELAAQPAPDQSDKMDVESSKPAVKEQEQHAGDSLGVDEMDIDQSGKPVRKKSKTKSDAKRAAKVQKKRRSKPKNQIAFPKRPKSSSRRMPRI